MNRFIRAVLVATKQNQNEKILLKLAPFLYCEKIAAYCRRLFVYVLPIKGKRLRMQLTKDGISVAAAQWNLHDKYLHTTRLFVMLCGVLTIQTFY